MITKFRRFRLHKSALTIIISFNGRRRRRLEKYRPIALSISYIHGQPTKLLEFYRRVYQRSPFLDRQSNTIIKTQRNQTETNGTQYKTTKNKIIEENNVKLTLLIDQRARQSQFTWVRLPLFLFRLLFFSIKSLQNSFSSLIKLNFANI